MDATRIEDLRARRVWDSRGDPTVEVEISLAGGCHGRAIAPAGASTGRFEAIERRDGGEAFDGRDVHACLAGLRERIAPALRGQDVADPAALDALLEGLDPTPGFAELGGNALIATSLAVHAAAAAACGEPLWRWLAATAGQTPRYMPRPEIQVLGGGAHAAGRLDLQDLMVVPLGAITWSEGLDRVSRIQRATRRLLEARGLFSGYADEGGFWPRFDSNDAALELLTAAIEAAGLRPDEDAALSIDVAASQLAVEGGCRLALEARTLDPVAWGDWLHALVGRFPIRFLEDPFPEDDLAATGALHRRLQGRCRIVGDDLVATSAARIEAAAGHCDAVLIKPNQAGTMTRAAAALAAARRRAMLAITSARSGESEDADIVDIAVGWATPMIKVGALARGERTAKWNRGLRIAEMLGDPPLAALEDPPAPDPHTLKNATR
ncbi:MAG TPA: phosphopyruvate hydratase [Pseudomonadales bacterium]|nr:phosphopyruvate hydratase [Pseudomonadales bacterium]